MKDLTNYLKNNSLLNLIGDLNIFTIIEEANLHEKGSHIRNI